MIYADVLPMILYFRSELMCTVAYNRLICVCDDQLPECFISYVLYVYEWGSCAVSHGDVLRMLA